MVMAATRGAQPPFSAACRAGILAESGLHYVAEDGFVDLIGVDPCTADGFSDDFAAKIHGRKSGQAALKFSDGRANGGEYDGRIHGCGNPPEELRPLL